MSIDIAEYLAEVQRLHASGQTTEHSFRPALNRLFDSISSDVKAVNEPKAVHVGRPDFVFMRGEITVGHCEAKDIGLDVNPKAMRDANKAQFERYSKALPNLIYTNGLDFRFYKQAELVREISIADYLMGIQLKPDQFDALANQLRDFAAERLQTITSAEKLAEMMAGKAVLIKDILFNTLKEDKDLASELAGQFKAFQDQLIHDLNAEEFADIYAETIAYGMFAARLHDETLQDFTREEALTLLPKSNPFLRNLFGYVAGPTLDPAIARTVDELAEIFQATNLPKLFRDFGKFTQRNDPFIHFYETFLAQYNPAKRKARGVWYTPEPVVNFIVRAVDDVLKTEFGLADGLADTSKVTVDWDTGQTDKKSKPVTIKKELHRVQILDPAAGTGTFLAEVIRQIAPRIKDVAPGQWSAYVEKELIPRLHGFELLMASYAMCHMKLDMMLTSMGYKPTGSNPPRLGVYLTNSLEEGEKVNQTLPFAQWLSNEAKQANTVKNDVPVMVVIGNPPYSGISQNMGDWIVNLIEDYKYVDGKHFGERKHWLHDDYVKFIRFAEHMIERNGEGVLGFITNHGYLDNPTFRGMRWHLLNTFDKIWVLDLHGNAKKKEVAPDGSADKNVFDIQQGVALIIAAKKKTTDAKAEKPLATVWHGDLWGSRKEKYEKLLRSNTDDIGNTELSPQSRYFMFYDVNIDALEIYDTGFSIGEFFKLQSTGIISARDNLTVDFDVNSLLTKMGDFLSKNKSNEEVRIKYFGSKKKGKYLPGDSRGWRLAEKREIIQEKDIQSRIRKILYRPFDIRMILYDVDIVDWPRLDTMETFNSGPNYALLTPRMTADEFAPFISDTLISNKTGSRYDQSYFFPLYLYPAETELDQTRRVNMDPAIRRRIEEAAMGAPSSAPVSPDHPLPQGEKGEPDIAPRYDAEGRPNEVAIFDYIYGVLHCPAYRDTYREFLKIDFPRIPYPPSPQVFRDVAEKGGQLRRLHLMEDAAIGQAPYPFAGDGDSRVEKIEFEPLAGEGEAVTGRVFVNDGQYFDNVPQIAWEFHIGGYQPAQKWLKDRKGRELSFDDIRHYQKIIKILCETDRIMKTIDMPLA